MTFSHLQPGRGKGSSGPSGATVFVFATAIVLVVALGFHLVSAYRRARNDQTSRQKAAESQMPPGAKIVTRTGEQSPPPPSPSEPAKRPSVRFEPPPTPPAPPETALETGRLTPRDRPPPVFQPEPVPPASLNTARLRPLADTSVFAFPVDQRDRNNGAAMELTIKGNESYLLTRYDLSAIQGWIVHRAAWHARVKQGRPHTVGFTAFSGVWEEGDGPRHADTAGGNGATYYWAQHRRTPWRNDKAPLPFLLRGQGRSVFCANEAAPTNEAGGDWIAVPIEPVVIQALLSGAADSLAVSDEKGQLARSFRVASRESERESHYIEVVGAPAAAPAPAAPAEFKAAPHADLRLLKTCGVVLRWRMPDTAGVFRYELRQATRPGAWDRARPLPRHLVPWPGPAGEFEEVVVEGLKPETAYTFYLRAVGPAGQQGPIAETAIRTPGAMSYPETAAGEPFPAAPLPMAANRLTLRVAEDTTGLDPATGIILDRPADFPGTGKDSSFLWDRSSQTLHLRAAAGETLGFHLVFQQHGKDFPALAMTPSVFEGEAGRADALRFSFHQTVPSHLPTRFNPSAWQLDALLPLPRRFDPDTSPLAGRMPDQTCHSIFAEIQVPRDTPPGAYRARLDIEEPPGPGLRLMVQLAVLPIRLPDPPRFTIEFTVPPSLAMAHKGSIPGPGEALAIERAYHRLVREHRCALAMFPYTPQGICPAAFRPKTQGGGASLSLTGWSDWETRYQPLLTGEAFNGLPCRAPVPHLILPVYENWPTLFEKGFLCEQALATRADGRQVYAGPSASLGECLSVDFKAAWTAALRQFAARLQALAGGATAGLVWLDNQPVAGYRGRPPPWYLGQPRYRDEFLALETLARLVPAAEPAAAPLRFCVGAPDVAALALYGRGLFRRLLVREPSAHAWAPLRERAALFGTSLVFEQEVMPFEDQPLRTLAGALQAFFQGAEGWCVREAIGAAGDTPRADPKALLVNGRAFGLDEPRPSLRLKAVRRLQQDIDLLLQLQDRMGWTRAQLADFARAVAPAAGDPATMTSGDFTRLRRAAQELLSTP